MIRVNRYGNLSGLSPRCESFFGGSMTVQEGIVFVRLPGEDLQGSHPRQPCGESAQRWFQAAESRIPIRDWEWLPGRSIPLCWSCSKDGRDAFPEGIKAELHAMVCGCGIGLDTTTHSDIASTDANPNHVHSSACVHNLGKSSREVFS